MQILNISLGIEGYEHLKDVSVYNHNYYRLKSYGDWCYLDNDVLLEECHEDENYYTFSLGRFDKNNNFITALSWNSDFGSNGIEDLVGEK